MTFPSRDEEDPLIRKTSFSEEQIALAPRPAEPDVPAGVICRKIEITETTF